MRNPPPPAAAVAARPPRSVAAPAAATTRPTGTAAVALVAVELALMFFGATLPTPLYPLYRGAFHFGSVTLTLIYAVYVLGNLAALLFFGRLSDQIGRRAVSLPAIGLAIASTLAFLFADATAWLFVARILSGFATGLAAGAATAWITELQPRGDKAAAAVVATAANFAGLAVAPLLSGALARLAPSPLRLPYVVYLLLLVAGAVAVLVPRESVQRRASRLADVSLRPRLGVPRQILAAFVPPAITAFVTFALIGFYAALAPNLLNDSLQLKSPLMSGAVVFLLFLVATAAVPLTGRLGSRTAMLAGLALLLPSLALLTGAELLRSLSILLAATGFAGIAAALGYRGSLDVVNRIAPAEQRAELVSSYLIAVYAGNSLPIIGIGLVSAWASPTVARLAFAAVIGVLAVTAFGTGMRAVPHER